MSLKVKVTSFKFRLRKICVFAQNESKVRNKACWHNSSFPTQPTSRLERICFKHPLKCQGLTSTNINQHQARLDISAVSLNVNQGTLRRLSRPGTKVTSKESSEMWWQMFFSTKMWRKRNHMVSFCRKP